MMRQSKDCAQCRSIGVRCHKCTVALKAEHEWMDSLSKEDARFFARSRRTQHGRLGMTSVRSDGVLPEWRHAQGSNLGTRFLNVARNLGA